MIETLNNFTNIAVKYHSTYFTEFSNAANGKVLGRSTRLMS